MAEPPPKAPVNVMDPLERLVLVADVVRKAHGAMDLALQAAEQTLAEMLAARKAQQEQDGKAP